MVQEIDLTVSQFHKTILYTQKVRFINRTTIDEVSTNTAFCNLLQVCRQVYSTLEGMFGMHVYVCSYVTTTFQSANCTDKRSRDPGVKSIPV